MNREIILLAESLDVGRGGAETYLKQLIGFLLARGHPVRAYLRHPGDAFLAPGLAVAPLTEFSSSMSGPIFSTLPLPGITHFQPHSGLQRRAEQASRATRDQLIYRAGHVLFSLFNQRRRRLRRAEAAVFAAHAKTKIMVFSRRVAEQVRQDYALAPERLAVSPLGVDLERFQPGSPPPSPPIKLFFSGHNFRLKGLHCLLPALRRARENGLAAELLVAGAGKAEDFLKLVSRLKLSPHVHFLGALTAEQTAARYRECTALVHPTFTDHCSLVTIEALASGLPVITTQQNGAAEWMTHGQHGFVIPHPRDTAALTAALEQFQNPARVAALRAACVALRPQLAFQRHAEDVRRWLFET